MSFNFPDINKEATLDRIYEKTKVTEFCKKTRSAAIPYIRCSRAGWENVVMPENAGGL